MTLTALIADDEPLLRQALAHELSLVAPDLEIVVEVENGVDAIEWLSKNNVDIVFLDIRMPGLNGLEVAQFMLNKLSTHTAQSTSIPLIVFVTAYDEYAVEAFETEALDYLLKPISADRLMQTMRKIRAQVSSSKIKRNTQELEIRLQSVLDKIADSRKSIQRPADTLRSIPASIGGQLRLFPIDDVILLQAEDKYVSVFTESQHALIREPLKELIPRLPADRFAQIHRSSIVNLAYVIAADRTVTGKMSLSLRGLTFKPAVSRSYRHLFKAM